MVPRFQVNVSIVYLFSDGTERGTTDV